MQFCHLRRSQLRVSAYSLIVSFSFSVGLAVTCLKHGSELLRKLGQPCLYRPCFTPIYKLHHSPIFAISFASSERVHPFFFFVYIKVMVLTDSFPCMILHRRNLACRGCGCPRSESQVSSMSRQALGMPSPRLPTSPRFASSAGTSFHASPSIPNSSHYPTVQQGARYPVAAQPVANAKPASPSHPLLTPSGRSFSVGGKVQNISSDPSAPCIMYWPDNEPFPEQGQIRPSNLVGVPVRQFELLGNYSVADLYCSNLPS